MKNEKQYVHGLKTEKTRPPPKKLILSEVQSTDSPIPDHLKCGRVYME